MPDRTFRNSILAAGITVVTATMCALVGWRMFEFDKALFLYAQTLIASLGLTVYRFTIWLHRPPTRMMFCRAVSLVRTTESRMRLGKYLTGRVVGYFVLNRFVWQRGFHRWSAHWPIMIGCIASLAIVVPLIFGWVWFETPAEDLNSYKVMNFGVHLTTIRVDSFEAFIVFHGLVWASFPVLIGCGVALWRRMQDRGDRAVQSTEHDLLPLILLLAIAVTGLMMTVSYSFLGGIFHRPFANIHMIVVCGTLLWLPYSKLFHIPQRTLKLAHMICEHESTKSKNAECVRCGEHYASLQQVQDLITVQQQLGYRYELRSEEDHYQQVCPRCRRTIFVLAHGSRWQSVPNVEAADVPRERELSVSGSNVSHEN